MKIIVQVIALCLTIASIQAFDTEKYQEVHGRQLQDTYNWKIFHYTCGTTFYACGGTTIDPETSCKASQNVTTIGKMTTAQCLNMNNLTRTGEIYKALCPNGLKVTKYSKYRKLGIMGIDGKLCSPKKGCLCCHGADGFGDPHFVTYDGTPYSFHGQCDLVMAKSPEFADGLGLYVHGRTEIIEDSWSLISNAAVRIGDDVLELTNKGTLYFNGNEISADEEGPMSMAGVYNITREIKMLNDIPKTDVSVSLNEGKSKVKFSLFKRLIAVHVGAAVEDTNGMLGNRAIDGLVGRNNIVLDSANDMGAHWQVTDEEPMLFREAAFPQYPETCVLPKVESRNRKLRSSPVHRRRAEESCAGVTGDKLQFCIEDVLLTGDHEIGLMYGDAY